MTEFTCHQCGETKTYEGVGTGYGCDKNDNKICYACCGLNDEKEIIELKPGERTVQYWDGKNIINWPSSLIIKPTKVSKGKHNIAGSQENIHFSFKGFNFHAVNYGNNSQIAYIKKLKS